MAKRVGNHQAVYNSAGITLSDGDETGLFVDAAGNLLTASGTGASSNQVQGTAADNAAAVGNPVRTGAKYNLAAPTYGDGDVADTQADVNGNTKVTQATRLDALNDRVTTFDKGYTPVNLTASGQILSGPGRLKGFYVNSTTAGTIVLRDALTATTPVISGTITPAVGYHEFPASLSTGGYATIGGTLDVTFFTRLTPTTSS